MILAENRSIAEDNLSKEPRLLQLKAELEEKYANLKHIHDEYQLNQSKMGNGLDLTLIKKGKIG